MVSQLDALCARLQQLAVQRFESDSRRVQAGDLFVCRRGPSFDSHQSVDQAIANGAVAILAERPLSQPVSVPVLVSGGFSNSLLLLSRLADYPQDKLTQIGVTGTNGKTTVAYSIKQMLQLQANSGYTGTLGCLFGDHQVPLLNTTPDPVQLLSLMAHMRRHQLQYHAMEVSSHALDQERTSPINFDVAVFTNIGADHLDYHGSAQAYLNAKLRLIERLNRGGIAVVNLDDEVAPLVLDRCRNKAKVISFARRNAAADLYAAEVVTKAASSQFTLRYQQQSFAVTVPLPFGFNVDNALAMLAVMVALQFDINTAIAALAQLQPVPGRGEAIRLPNGALVIIDYAHNADGLGSLLNNVARHCQGELVVLFGISGDRLDQAAAMGKAASVANSVVLSSDNPLGQDPQRLAQAAIAGITHRHHQVQLDRRQAIVAALSQLQGDDILVLAGKGDERHQYMLADKSQPQSYPGDAAVVHEFIQSR